MDIALQKQMMISILLQFQQLQEKQAVAEEAMLLLGQQH